MKKLNSKERAKLVVDLDKDGRWFQKAARHYRTREWAKEMRQALGIKMHFLAEETQVSRATLYLAEQKEATGAIQIAELEALAEAMECKLVYAIVPERGTVAELAERRRENPRKGRKQREKEAAEYMEWYAKEVEKIQKQGAGPRSAALRKELEVRGERPEGRGIMWQGTDGRGAPVRPVHSPGVQKLVDDIGKNHAGAVALAKIKRDVEEWKKQGTGIGEQGSGNREQGTVIDRKQEL